MSRTLSSAMLQAMFAQQTGEAVLVLLTIDHDDLVSPIRVTSDAVDTESNGSTYVAFPFEIVLPDEPESGNPRASLRISNIDRQIIDTLMSIAGAPTVTIQVVRGSAPDTVEISWPDFKLRTVTYDATYVSGELTLEDFTTEPWPADIYAPSTFPALF